MHQHSSKYLPTDPLPYPHHTNPQTLGMGMGSVSQISTFTDHGHVSYQIIESRMQQHGI